MKMATVLDLLMLPPSLRSACDIMRACTPTNVSPISPSISALGTSAATESRTTMSTEPERMMLSMISRASSPVVGWLTYSLSTLTPRARAYSVSSACSASTNSAMPPSLCASAIAWSAMVVLPLDSVP